MNCECGRNEDDSKPDIIVEIMASVGRNVVEYVH